ncbi:hypothetical protein BDZ94DRAFT_1261163 [Collybia nuda]|uniref:Uncharacterized protein n=1 Tax=Collybia nuda TaxID=64659 RepID=A0A9P6CJ75_9AGAR|nr:hypothetical protein BDZ94DRAFT_1261163 [Collybia nuda]
MVPLIVPIPALQHHDHSFTSENDNFLWENIAVSKINTVKCLDIILWVWVQCGYSRPSFFHQEKKVSDFIFVFLNLHLTSTSKGHQPEGGGVGQTILYQIRFLLAYDIIEKNLGQP